MDRNAAPSANDHAAPVLTVSGLAKSYGGAFALQGIGFSLHRGEVVGLLGPNGAGKTTTLKTLAGLLRPDAGQILIAGHPQTSEQARRALAYIPEVPALFELLTVWEHLSFTAQAYSLGGGWKSEGERLLERLGLSEKRYEVAASLSKGMRQKLMIAAALLRSPQAFLFDEPVVGLDPAGAAELMQIIGELAAQGRAVVVSTHQLSIAERICQRVLVMNAGRLVAAGPVAELRERLALGGSASLEDVFFALTAGDAASRYQLRDEPGRRPEWPAEGTGEGDPE